MNDAGSWADTFNLVLCFQIVELDETTPGPVGRMMTFSTQPTE